MSYEIKLPEAGFSLPEATIIEWFKRVGDQVQEGDVILSVETDKVNVDIPAPGNGILTEICFQAGDLVSVGDVLGVISSTAEAEERGQALEMDGQSVAQEDDTTPPDSRETPPGKKRRISSLAKAIAKREGVDLSLISSGSGPSGRIIKEDVLNVLEQTKEQRAPTREPISRRVSAIPQTPEAAGKKVNLTHWRKVIADRMTASWTEVPHHAQSMDIDVTGLSTYIAKSKINASLPRLSYLPFLMKAIQAGIKLTPQINAYCYDDHYVVQEDLNIGIAVDVEGKLLVPVVRNVETKSILELAREFESLITKTREGGLEPKDVQGGTITISNVGSLGLLSGFSIIIPPQTTIVCVGAVREVPSVENGSIEIRKKMFITNSYDHRAVHGGPASRFFTEVRDKLEDLNSLLLTLH